jgi:hypothetical protein
LFGMLIRLVKYRSWIPKIIIIAKETGLYIRRDDKSINEIGKSIKTTTAYPYLSILRLKSPTSTFGSSSSPIL